MKITVQFLGPIARNTQTFDVNNLKELNLKLREDESIKEWLPKLAVAVNDKIIKDLNFTFSDGDKVSLLPPVCGG
jgi:molybdopterin synthase sulfur carrier subunit